MESDKAPGLDGFTACFIKVCWKIIKHNLHRMIQNSQSCRRIGRSTNITFLALIPKEKGSTSFDRFRPIYLYNIGYKIITKIMANRIKTILPAVILENLGGFIKGRNISDNIILVQEAIHSSQSRKEKGMIMKLDLASAFDRVRHNFLYHVMQQLGFDHSFVKWTQACIGIPWITPLVNDQVAGFFKATRGLRKGFPLSLLLYAIQASMLSFQQDHS
jgi:hypothetical protein